MPYLFCPECRESNGWSREWALEWARCEECGAHTWLRPAERVE